MKTLPLRSAKHVPRTGNRGIDYTRDEAGRGGPQLVSRLYLQA